MRLTRGSVPPALLLLTLALWCCPALATATEAAPALPPDFRAEYLLRKAGIPIARTEIRLWREANVLHYRSRSETIGIAALFRDDVITEEARLELGNDGVARPRSYVYRHSHGSRLREDHADFDWTDGRARGEVKGKPFDIEIPPGTTDHFSLQLRLIQDLQRPDAGTATADRTYPVVERGRLKSFTFHFGAGEALDTALGRIDTVQAERVNTRRGSRVVTWYAPALHHLPVRVEQTEGDGGRLTLTLEAIAWSGSEDRADEGANK